MPQQLGGTQETGWLSKWAFQVGALAADSIGRQAVEDKFVQQNMLDDFYVKLQEVFMDVLAAAADSVRNDEDLSAALPIAFTITAQPDVPRTITWALNSHAQITAFTLTITGVTAKGANVTETFTDADGWSGETANAFAVISTIAMTARTGTGAADTADIGMGSKVGLANNIDATTEVFKIKKNNAHMDLVAYTVDPATDTIDLSTGVAINAGDDFTVWYKSNVRTMV